MDALSARRAADLIAIVCKIGPSLVLHASKPTRLKR